MTQINKIGVVGAGTMGSAIAQHFAMKGLEVQLVDSSEQSLERGLGLIRSSLDEAHARRLFSDDEYQRILQRIQTTTLLNDLASVDLVVEAVFEDLAVKQNLFLELEKMVSDHCILASNTSSFLVSDIAAHLRCPQRVVGVHYFYHAAKNKLVEVIPGVKTNPVLLQALMDFYTFYDKTPIVVADAPGFAVNRFFVPWLNEAARCYEEGLGSIAVIDKVACEAFGVGMGPFALMNATGVPIAQHAAEGLAKKLGDFYAPATALCEQVNSGKPWNLDSTEVLNNGTNNEAAIRTRLLGATLGVACQMVQDKVVSATETDLGARVGLRWPKGPFELIAQLGAKEVATMVGSVFGSWGLELPKVGLSDTSALQLQWVESFCHERAGFLVLNLPDRMNPLGEAVVNQIETHFNQLDANTEIDKIFILGKGKAFIAGADIKFFLDAMAANDLLRIERFTEHGQSVLNTIAASKKTTYAYLDGLTLGGGLELALACDYRIGTNRTLVAFPETGIGIYPGLGGTQRTARLIGKAQAKMLIATGKMLKVEQAYQLGLVDTVIEPVFNPKELASVEIEGGQQGLVANAEAYAVFADFTGDLPFDSERKDDFEPYLKALQKRAPIALKTAMTLIDQGLEVSLEQGLQMELDGLKAIFSTADAKTGLSSIINGEKPQFVGH